MKEYQFTIEMNFCSKYGYDYGFEGSETESLDESEFEMINHLNGLDRTKQKLESTKKRIRKADTNIISVKFDELKLNRSFNENIQQITKCENCTAVFTWLSESKIVDDHILWECEYCDKKNFLPVKDENNNTNGSSSCNGNVSSAQKSDDVSSTCFDDSYLIFCIDVRSVKLYFEKTNVSKLKFIYYISKLCCFYH